MLLETNWIKILGDSIKFSMSLNFILSRRWDPLATFEVNRVRLVYQRFAPHPDFGNGFWMPVCWKPLRIQILARLSKLEAVSSIALWRFTWPLVLLKGRSFLAFRSQAALDWLAWHISNQSASKTSLLSVLPCRCSLVHSCKTYIDPIHRFLKVDSLVPRG